MLYPRCSGAVCQMQRGVGGQMMPAFYFSCKALARSSNKKNALGPQVVIRFFPLYHHVFTIHSGVLTATAECLTALHAVCRISAALPGFSRFLVNLRVDSAAISSSERPPNTSQPGDFCGSQTWASSLLPWADWAVFTHTDTDTYTRARFFSHTSAEDACRRLELDWINDNTSCYAFQIKNTFF